MEFVDMNTEERKHHEQPSFSEAELVQMDDKEARKKNKSVEKANKHESDSLLAEKNDKQEEANDSVAVAKVKSSKNRKKYDCSVQHVLRALNSLTTPEEKLAAMCKKYADLFDENRKLQTNSKQLEKQLFIVLKERDQVRSDLAKSVLSRSKLESLCRELQRQNKEIKEESFQKIRDEEEKRKEVSAKFQVTLNEITDLMKQDNDKTMKLRDDNIDMTSKLKSIYEQYEMREQQIEKMAKQMALESQLYEARIAKLEMETSAEKEMLLREKQQLLVTLTEYQAKFQEYQSIEMTLRNQVALYNNKYEEFEKSLTRSNKMFGGFKEEMESMSNKIIKLESETAAWKLRWEKTQKALIEMAAEKQKSDQEIVVAAKQMATLHKLCRTLQTERAQLLAKLKHNSTSSCCSDTLTEDFSENASKVSNGNRIEHATDERIKKSEKFGKGLKNENSELKMNKNTSSRCVEKVKVNQCNDSKKDCSTVCPSTTAIAEANNPSTDALLVGVSNMQLNSVDAKEQASRNESSSQVSEVDGNVTTSECACSTKANNLIKDQQSVDSTSNLNNNFDLNEDSLSNTCCTRSGDVITSSNVELKQYAFPQTDTFSFTYNGNILNELQNNFENNIEKQTSALPSTTTSLVTNSEKFVFKKSTHSSKTKISSKKKNKK